MLTNLAADPLDFPRLSLDAQSGWQLALRDGPPLRRPSTARQQSHRRCHGVTRATSLPQLQPDVWLAGCVVPSSRCSRLLPPGFNWRRECSPPACVAGPRAIGPKPLPPLAVASYTAEPTSMSGRLRRLSLRHAFLANELLPEALTPPPTPAPKPDRSAVFEAVLDSAEARNRAKVARLLQGLGDEGAGEAVASLLDGQQVPQSEAWAAVCASNTGRESNDFPATTSRSRCPAAGRRKAGWAPCCPGRPPVPAPRSLSGGTQR